MRLVVRGRGVGALDVGGEALERLALGGGDGAERGGGRARAARAVGGTRDAGWLLAGGSRLMMGKGVLTLKRGGAGELALVDASDGREAGVADGGEVHGGWLLVGLDGSSSVQRCCDGYERVVESGEDFSTCILLILIYIYRRSCSSVAIPATRWNEDR